MSKLDILELQLLPNLAIARFGSSRTPLENYDLVTTEGEDFRKIVPALTFDLDEASGKISTHTPSEIKFRDAEKRVKPVCPFFEAWVKTSESAGTFVPLTLERLKQAGMSSEGLDKCVSWNIRLANLKAFRRTGDHGDRIELLEDPMTGKKSLRLSGHKKTSLLARAENFLDGKAISFGYAQFADPMSGEGADTEEMREALSTIRLRFYPSEGRIYGAKRDEEDADDNVPKEREVYDSSKGNWVGHRDRIRLQNDQALPARARLPTLPVLYRFTRGRYIDDSCDGIIELTLAVPGQDLLTAKTRVCSGPPDYAPDGFPIRSLADDLEQIRLGASVEAYDADELIDIVRRAFETVTLMNTEVYSTSLPARPTRPWWQSRVIGVFGEGGAKYDKAVADHSVRLRQLIRGLRLDATKREKRIARSILRGLETILREYDQVNNYSPEKVREMPALMIGSDGHMLSATQRMRSKMGFAANTMSRETGVSGMIVSAARRWFGRT